MKKSAAATATATRTAKIRTMLITVSTRSLVLSSLIIVLSVNTSSTFQYDWWNNLTNTSSQEAMRQTQRNFWLPADRPVKLKLWSTSWTPMLSVTPEVNHSQSTTPAPHESPDAAAAVSSSSHPALPTLSHASSTPLPPSQPSTAAARRKSESLEWQPSISGDQNDADRESDRDDFNAFAARNTRTYVPVEEMRDKSEEIVHQPLDSRENANLQSNSGPKVSWDDRLEFPSSTRQPKKFDASTPDLKATTASIWADHATSPVDSLTSSTNSKKWSSRTGPLRITNRYGTMRLRKQEADKPSLGDDIQQNPNLEKSYEDAISDIQSHSDASSLESEGSDSTDGEIERLVVRGKTNSNERLAVKGRQPQQQEEKSTASKQPKRQKVALQIKISPVEQDAPVQQWSNAKVSQFFRWENPAKSSERLVENDAGQSSEEFKAPVKSSAFRETVEYRAPVTSAKPVQRSTTRANVNRSGAVKGMTSSSARQRQTTTPVAIVPDDETEVLTERSVTTRQPQLGSVYEKASRQAAKQRPVTTKQNRLSASAKAQSVVQSNGRGYEWSTDIDHNDDRPAEIKTSTFREQEDPPQTTLARFANPTTTSGTTTTITTARPTASRLQTKSRQQVSQRQSSVGILKSSFENEDYASSADSQDDETKGKLQKKSGVQYTASTGEREEDVSGEKDFNKKSGEQANGNPDDPENCRLEDSIPGTPLTDYPTYSELPMTSFKCSDQNLPGYYGDVEAQCQVFHVCQADGRKNDFLCPVGTIFNQEIFVCDWWQNFRCQDTPNFYRNNDELYKTPVRSPEISSNQLRKRTDSIEREDEPPFSDEVRDDSDSVSDDSSPPNSDAGDVDLSPAPVSRAPPVAAAVKGYNEKQTVTEQSIPAAGIKSGRVVSYGTRVSRKRLQGDHLSAAASKSRTTLSPNVNVTEVVREATMKMSTSALPLPVN